MPTQSGFSYRNQSLLAEESPMTQENEAPIQSGGDPTVANQGAHTAPPRKTRIFVIGRLCALVLVAVGLIPRIFPSRDLRRQKSQQAATAANVFVTPAQGAAASVTVQLSGTMSPITEAPVLARVDGYLQKRLVDIGDHVHTGQVLGVIASPDLDQQVEQAKALLQQSKSTLAQSQAALDQAQANA